MESKRQQKFSKMIQKELAEIFQRDAKNLFGGAFITVTDVTVSPDLGLARAYLSFLLTEDKKQLLKKIREEKPKIKNLLAGKIKKQVRIIPELEFYIDETQDQAARIEEIFSKINIPPADSKDSDTTNDKK